MGRRSGHGRIDYPGHTMKATGRTVSSRCGQNGQRATNITSMATSRVVSRALAPSSLKMKESTEFGLLRMVGLSHLLVCVFTFKKDDLEAAASKMTLRSMDSCVACRCKATLTLFLRISTMKGPKRKYMGTEEDEGAPGQAPRGWDRGLAGRCGQQDEPVRPLPPHRP